MIYYDYFKKDAFLLGLITIIIILILIFYILTTICIENNYLFFKNAIILAIQNN